MTNTNTPTTDLPKGWVQMSLGEVADYLNGRAFKPAEWEKEGLPIIRIQNLNDCAAEFNYTTQKLEDRYFVNNGDLLFAWSASLGSYIWNRGPAWLNQHIFKVIPKEFIVKLFLHYYLEKTILELYSKTHGSGMVHITKGKFEATPILLPPLAEQRRIVAKIEELFSDLDHSVAALEQARAQLKIYRQAVLKYAFEGKLTEQWRQQHTPPPAAELLARIQAERAKSGQPTKPLSPLTEAELAELPSLPEGWVWVKLGELGEVRLGRQRSPKNHIGNYMRPYLRAANATWDGVNLSDVKEMNFSPEEFDVYRLQKGDILLAEASGSLNEVGKPFVWNEQISDCCFQNTLIRVRLHNLSPQFFCLHFLTDALTGRLGRIAKGVGIHHLGAERLAILPVVLPPLEEQHAIVAEIEARLSVVDKLEETIATSLQEAEALRQSILKQAFAGKLVPQDPADEPATLLLERIKNARGASGAKDANV